MTDNWHFTADSSQTDKEILAVIQNEVKPQVLACMPRLPHLAFIWHQRSIQQRFYELIIEILWNSLCFISFRWRHNEHNGISNHQSHDCLLKRLFRRRSKETLKLRVTGLCVGNSPGTGEFPAQRASNAENVSIWWRHYVLFWWCNQVTSVHMSQQLSYRGMCKIVT